MKTSRRIQQSQVQLDPAHDSHFESFFFLSRHSPLRSCYEILYLEIGADISIPTEPEPEPEPEPERTAAFLPVDSHYPTLAETTTNDPAGVPVLVCRQADGPYIAVKFLSPKLSTRLLMQLSRDNPGSKSENIGVQYRAPRQGK